MINTRAELHLHTKLSDDISVIDVEEIIKIAERFGISAIAFTNLSNVQDIPKIAKCAQGTDIKIIYGAEVFYESESGCRGNKLTLLAKNDAGIKALYNVISSMKDDGVCRLIDLAVLKQNRENLLVGSSGSDGELFYNISAGKSVEELTAFAEFYDYLEIYPSISDESREINRKVVEIAEEIGIPVVAASNAHYLEADDAICRDVVRVVRGFDSSEENELYLRTTEQMLDEFSYLGDETARAIVVTNTQQVADLIERVNPVKDGYYDVKYENAFAQIEKICMEKATQIYGNPLPETVIQRLQTELELIDERDFASRYFLAYQLARHVKDMGGYFGLRGTAGASLVVFLLGVSNVNPLAAHYHCLECHYFEESTAAKDGYDLPVKCCPNCNEKLKADGHDIPFESFMGADGAKMPDFDICVTSEIRMELIKYLAKHFGPTKIALSGTVLVLFDSMAHNYLNIYKSRTGKEISCEQEEKIVGQLIGVKRNWRIHPGGIMIVPNSMTFEDFTPINGQTISFTHFDFKDLHDTIFKINILRAPVLSFLDALQKATGVSLEKIDINSPEVLELFKTADTLGLPEFDREFTKNLLRATQPTTFDDLVKICGFAHGTNVWTNNGEHLIERGVSLSQIPTTKEDIMNDLMGLGVDRKTSFLFSERVRKGLFVKGRVVEEDVSRFKELCRPLGNWYFDFCTNILYVFQKPHAIFCVTTDILCAYFKKYYPKEFYTEYINNFFGDKDNLTKEELEKLSEIKDALNRYL